MSEAEEKAGSPLSREKKERLTLRRGAPQAPSEVVGFPWTILVVDDEPDVHAMTRLLLRDFRFRDRPFEVLSAMSAAEARGILARRPDIPVVLLDVVMETPDAGLDLVRHIREDLGNQRMAIVLRTGQPGEAPEREIMLAYDINDYRAKSEMTAQRLFTTLVGGLRSWATMNAVDSLAVSLEQRVEERTRELAEARHFAETLVEALPHPLWFSQPDGRVAIRNQAFREMFGEDDAVRAALPPSLAGLGGPGGAASLEAGVDLPSGMRTLLIRTAPVTGQGGVDAGTIGIITDITERKQMESRLRALATIDDLTGVLNRRAFFAAATQELDRARRYGNRVSVVMIDLDHFKRVNDRHGHAVGDGALQMAVTAMRGALRDVDILGRLGGEEFAALLPETSLAGGCDVAERLRQAVAAQQLVLADGRFLRLTASLGVAERANGEMGVDPMLARADAALYRAKAEGRDRVVA